jgi:hypothetical protein
LQLLALKNTYDDIINKKSTYDITNSINNTNSTNITTTTTTTTASSSVSHRQSQSITQLNSTAPITSYIQDNLIDYYDDIVKVLFMNLKNAYQTESKVESDFWLDTLISKPIIWIRKQFIEPYRIAFQHFINFPLTITTEPFLYIIDSNNYHHHYEFKDFTYGSETKTYPTFKFTLGSGDQSKSDFDDTPEDAAFDFYIKIGFECIGEENIELDFGYVMEDFKMLKKLS